MKSENTSHYSKIAICFMLVLTVIFIVPIFVYGTVSAFTGLQVPGESAVIFLTGVLISKVGTAVAFVALFYLARDTFVGRWPLYAFIWWIMFAFGEVGQAIGPNYSWGEALAGGISEAIYLPLSACLLNWFFRV
jgi:hypothetical protein